MLLTVLSVLNASLLGVLIILLLKFKSEIPDIQQVLDDVGASIGEQFAGIFEKPAVTKAMSVLGKKSGEVRADKALRSKAANAILDQFPSARFILEQLDMTPEEGLQLLRDPMVGPYIQNMLSKGAQGLGGFLGSSSGRPASGPKNGDVFKVT